MTPLFYVIAPPYNAASAGSRVLYGLVEQLNLTGCEAYAVVHEAWDPPDPRERPEIQYLTPSLAQRHYKLRRTPVCVFPEALGAVTTTGIHVMYVLNLPGLLGQTPPLAKADFVFAYSGDLASRLERCDGLLFLPVSDADYWTPDPATPRVVPCVYEGKFVAQHMQAIPERLREYPRIGRWSPPRDEVRRILRSSTCCYVFENTALATEAALCGCPVVYQTNAFFHGLLASQELGLNGFTEDDTPASLAAAARAVPEFRRRYVSAAAAVPSAVESFVAQTWPRAAAMAPDRPFELRCAATSTGSHTAAPPATVGDPLQRPATQLDVALAYNVVLVREAEASTVLAPLTGAPLEAVLRTLAGSVEFRDRIAGPLLEATAVTVDTRLHQTGEMLLDWICSLLAPLAEGPTCWRGLAALVRSDPVMYGRVAELLGGTGRAVLLDRALDALQRLAPVGFIDQIGDGLLSGWALDPADSRTPLRLRVVLPDEREAIVWTGSERRDVALRFQGGERAGFVCSTPPMTDLSDDAEITIMHADTGRGIATQSLGNLRVT